MKEAKQILARECLANPKYRVDTEKGILYYHHKASDEWRVKTPSVTEGYLQYILFRGRGKGKGIGVYAQHVTWLAAGRSIPEGMELDHDDSVKANNRLDNLKCVTHKQNIANRRHRDPDCIKPYKRLTKDEVAEILKCQRKGESAYSLAKRFNRTHPAILYQIRKNEGFLLRNVPVSK